MQHEAYVNNCVTLRHIFHIIITVCMIFRICRWTKNRTTYTIKARNCTPGNAPKNVWWRRFQIKHQFNELIATLLSSMIWWLALALRFAWIAYRKSFCIVFVYFSIRHNRKTHNEHSFINLAKRLFIYIIIFILSRDM